MYMSATGDHLPVLGIFDTEAYFDHPTYMGQRDYTEHLVAPMPQLAGQNSNTLVGHLHGVHLCAL